MVPVLYCCINYSAMNWSTVFNILKTVLGMVMWSYNIILVLDLHGSGFSVIFLSVFLCRMEAVYLLNTLVDQCTSEVFEQHSEQWVRALLKILQVLFVKCIEYLLSVHSCHCRVYVRKNVSKKKVIASWCLETNLIHDFMSMACS